MTSPHKIEKINYAPFFKGDKSYVPTYDLQCQYKWERFRFVAYDKIRPYTKYHKGDLVRVEYQGILEAGIIESAYSTFVDANVNILYDVFCDKVLKKGLPEIVLCRRESLDEKKVKLALIGSGGVGKTAFVKKLITDEFEKRYAATVGAEVRPITFDFSNGPFTYNVWDIAGQDRLVGLRDGMFIGTQCAIMIFSVLDAESYEKIFGLYRDLMRHGDDIPIVLIGNKVDLVSNRMVDFSDRMVDFSEISFYRKKNVKYFELSIKNNVIFDFDEVDSTGKSPVEKSIDEPFLWLMRRLSCDNSIQFK